MHTVFFIGDTHFGHKNIIKFDIIKDIRKFDTIEEHDEELIKRWNSVVRPKDIVFHLGDFCFGKQNIPIAGRLNGDKRLIMGNHDYDSETINEYLKYFTKVGAYRQYSHMLLSHMPVAPSQFGRYLYNIHGHKHHHNEEDPRYVNVSAEQINLTPISLEELIKKHDLKLDRTVHGLDL